MIDSASLSIKDILNLQRTDRLCCLGLDKATQEHIKQVRSSCSIVVVAMDKLELEQGKQFKDIAYTYDGVKEVEDGDEYFDKVFCFFPGLSNSHRSVKYVLDNCYYLCKRGGMGLVAGLTNEKDVQNFQQKHYVDTWTVAKTSKGFNLLFKKNRF